MNKISFIVQREWLKSEIHRHACQAKGMEHAEGRDQKFEIGAWSLEPGVGHLTSFWYQAFK